jgi:hypothetical protein
VRCKPVTISLAGLLDYDEDDWEEGAVELALAGEAFNEMLLREYAARVLDALYAER